MVRDYSEYNQGCKTRIVTGIDHVFENEECAIIIEDDILVHDTFFRFCQEMLEYYKDDDKIGVIQAMNLCPWYEDKPDKSYYLSRYVETWGWATWKRAWEKFEPSGEKLLSILREKNLTKTFDFEGTYPFTRMLERQIAGQNNSWAIRWKASLLVNGMISVNAGKSLVANNGFDESGTNCGGGELIPTELFEGKISCFRPDSIEECLWRV